MKLLLKIPGISRYFVEQQSQKCLRLSLVTWIYSYKYPVKTLFLDAHYVDALTKKQNTRKKSLEREMDWNGFESNCGQIDCPLFWKVTIGKLLRYIVIQFEKILVYFTFQLQFEICLILSLYIVKLMSIKSSSVVVCIKVIKHRRGVWLVEASIRNI